MQLRAGYVYLYARARSPPAPWFVEQLKRYFEEAYPAYIQKYLGISLVVEPAGYITYSPEHVRDWMDFFSSVRRQVGWGYGALLVMTDVHYSEIDPACRCAGADYYTLWPNFAWTSIRNWEEVMELAARYPVGHYLHDPYYALMLGDERRRGIRALTVGGHELTHYVLLMKGGVGLSDEIDGGRLSGLVFLDEAMNPVQKVSYSPPNFVWAMQRVREDLPYHSNQGAYFLYPWALLPF